MEPIYEVWQTNRAIKASDLSDGFRWPLDNLALALKRFLQPQPGVFRGGKVKQTGAPSKNVLVEPMGGLTNGGELLILDAETPLAVPDNGSPNPRIDLVSIKVDTVDNPQVSRPFWNPGTEESFTQNTVVSRRLLATPVLTTGTPAGVPVAPATPAGHIALATISVAAGFSVITDAQITRSQVPDPLQLTSFAGAGGANALPYVPDPRLRLSVRTGGVALVFAMVTVNSNSGFNAASVHKPLEMTIEEVGGGVIGRTTARLWEGDTRTLTAAGMVTGPKSPAAAYQLRFAQAAGLHTGTDWSSINITEALNLFGAIAL